MPLRSQLAYVAAGLTLALGLLGLLNPVLTLRLSGLGIAEPRGLGEARALYGAMLLTMGGYMFWALATKPRAAGVLRFAGILWLGSATGRVLSLLLEGPFTVGSMLLLLFDLAVGTGSLLGSMDSGGRTSKPNRSEEGEPDDPLRAYRS